MTSFTPPPHPRFFRTGAAFTLIELLTVIAIVAVLAALLFPVVGRMQASASKAKCSSKLRQLMIASIGYAADHDGILPYRNATQDWRHPHVYNKTDFAQFEPYLGGVGRDEALSCPGPLKQFRSPESAGYGGPNALYMTYSYYNLKTLSPEVFTAYRTTFKEIQRLSLIPSNFPLWSCITYSNGTTFVGHSNPSTTEEFEGQNAAYADGSVRWVAGADFMPFITEAPNTFYGPKP